MGVTGIIIIRVYGANSKIGGTVDVFADSEMVNEPFPPFSPTLKGFAYVDEPFNTRLPVFLSPPPMMSPLVSLSQSPSLNTSVELKYGGAAETEQLNKARADIFEK